MGDNILKYTLPPMGAGDETELKSLKSSYNPGALTAFQSVMQKISSQAYSDRQSKEMAGLGKQFDPTKVSGGTFKDIIGFVEQNRGADISRMHASTMDTATKSQQMIQDRIRDVENKIMEEKKMKEDNRRWEAEMSLKRSSAASKESDIKWDDNKVRQFIAQGVAANQDKADKGWSELNAYLELEGIDTNRNSIADKTFRKIINGEQFDNEE